MGKIRVCLLCKGFLERARTWCECKEARALRDAAAAEKEAVRRVKLPRIAWKDYELLMVYCDDCSEYVMDDSVEDHLEEHPDHVFFACTKAKASIEPCGGDVIEDIERMASEEIEDGEDRIDYKEGAREKLDAVLAAWFEEYVEVPDMFWQDNSLIVEVPDVERTE
jgi:hypothetical protein